ncbi:hypothetical protein ABVT39_016231 [Epinephelus coioides]
MEKKRKGGAEKLRDKKRQALQADAAKCQKLPHLFSAAASTAAPAVLASPSAGGGQRDWEGDAS